MKSLLFLYLNFFVFIVPNLIYGQPLFIHRMDEDKNRHILVRYFRENTTSFVSHAIVFQTLTIRTSNAPVCQILLSNAVVYSTRIERKEASQAENAIEQFEARFDEFSFEVECDTQVVYKNAVTNVLHFKLVEDSKSNRPVESKARSSQIEAIEGDLDRLRRRPIVEENAEP